MGGPDAQRWIEAALNLRRLYGERACDHAILLRDEAKTRSGSEFWMWNYIVHALRADDEKGLR